MGSVPPFPAPPACPGHECTPTQPLRGGTAEDGWDTDTKHRCYGTRDIPAAHFGGEGRGWVLKRPMERASTLSTLGSAPAPPCRWAESLPTWWRGWRQRRRPTDGGGQPLLQRPCQRHCGSGARSPPSESASAPRGPSGSQSGPDEPWSVSWGRGRNPLHPVSWPASPTACLKDTSTLQTAPSPQGPDTWIHQTPELA